MVSKLQINKVALWSPFRGKVGTEKAVINYARSLKEIGCEVVIIQLLDEFEKYRGEFRLIRAWPQSMNRIGKSNFFFRRDFYILGLLSTSRLKKILINENFDVAISFLMAIPLIKAIKLNGVDNTKLILSVQGFPKFLLKNDNIVSKLENSLRAYFWHRNYEFSDKILLMTKHTKQQLIEKFPRLKQKFTVLENPLFDGNIQKDQVLSKSRKRKIFFVGRYSYQKDFQLFSEITRILSEKLSHSLDFDVFGDFPNKIKNSRENCHLNFRGYERDFWHSLSRESDIHLITARWEDPGHAMLEGLAFGFKSIVAERNAPHVDIARNLDVPVVEPDPKIMALRVLEILEMPSDQIVHTRVSNHVLDVYGLCKFQQKITKIVRELSETNEET